MRLLVLANETCAAAAVLDEVSYRVGRASRPVEVLVVAPALAGSRLQHWLSTDVTDARSRAAERLEASIDALAALGIYARGELGDADPIQALEDGVRLFNPDEVLIATHPHRRSNWLERRVVDAARERLTIPVTHVVADLDFEARFGEVASRTERAPTSPQASPPTSIRLHHEVGYDGALAIRTRGFTDLPCDDGRSGVPMSDRSHEHAEGPTVFAIDVPAELAAAFEVGTESDGTRVFCLPAHLLNRFGPPRILGDDAIE